MPVSVMSCRVVENEVCPSVVGSVICVPSLGSNVVMLLK